MNCKNCGAPVQINEATGHLSCQYCHSHQWVDDKKSSADQLVPSQETTGLFCPGCMDENELQIGLIDKTRIAFCPSCFGFQIDSQALGLVLRNRRSEFRGADDAPIPVNPDELAGERACPSCRQKMETHPYYGPGNSVIDSCNACRQVWLDHGELNRLVRAPGVR